MVLFTVPWIVMLAPASALLKPVKVASFNAGLAVRIMILQVRSKKKKV